MADNLVIDNSQSISGFDIAVDSTITYGASFTLTGNKVDFTMSLDSKFSPISANDIKAYLVNSGELISEGVVLENNPDTNEFSLSINDSRGPLEERQVVLIYKRRMPEAEGLESRTFINNIEIEDLSSMVTVKLYEESDKPKLPDLF